MPALVEGFSYDLLSLGWVGQPARRFWLSFEVR
jgi:hypothetical protein